MLRQSHTPHRSAELIVTRASGASGPCVNHLKLDGRGFEIPTLFARAGGAAGPCHDNASPALRRPTAFTLLELVVVIAILAILAAVAVRSLSGLEDQTRFDVTQRQLANIQSAIDGDPGVKHPDGSNIPNGFVADVGRLPYLIGTNPKTQLQELWTQPAGVLAYGIRQAPAPDSDITMGAGWRGPYLQMPFGQQQLVDGWGNPYSITPTDITGETTPLASIQSLGSDNAAGSTNSDVYAADLPVNPIPFSTAEYLTTVTCIYSGSTAAGSAKIFQPDMTVPQGFSGFPPAETTSSTGVSTFIFTNVPPGSRVIRIYSDAASTIPLATQFITVPKYGLSNVVISSNATTQPTAPTTPSTAN